MKRAKPACTPEFRDLAVRRVKAGESVAGVAKEWGRVERSVRHGVKAAAKGNPNGAGKRMVTPEEIERSRRRAENARLQRELARVKRAAAYFAKDAL